MKLVEADAKALLADGGLRTPRGTRAQSLTEASAAIDELGAAVVKAQVPAGGRGKAGGVVVAHDADEASAAAERLLGSTLGDHVVDGLLIEERVDIARELYLAFAIDTAAGLPMVMASGRGGVDIEDDPTLVHTRHLAPGRPITDADVEAVCEVFGDDRSALADAVRQAHAVFNELRAILVEINPLVISGTGDVIALDAKIETDDSAPAPPTAAAASGEVLTDLEREASEKGLRLIELGGDVAILANGAGLTMTTMDAVSHHGGAPANFLEIGGDAYTLAEPALDITLRQAGVKSLVVNFCGAFARCDVMTEGVVNAWESLRPQIPVFFSIHGTGQDEARAMVRDRLGIEPFESMDDAVRAAIDAARASGGDR